MLGDEKKMVLRLLKSVPKLYVKSIITHIPPGVREIAVRVWTWLNFSLTGMSINEKVINKSTNFHVSLINVDREAIFFNFGTVGANGRFGALSGLFYK